MPVCLPTIECLVYQCISGRFESRFLTFSHRFLFFLMELMVVKAWSRDLCSCSTFLFDISQHRSTAFLRMSFHVVVPPNNVCTNFLRFSCRFGSVHYHPRRCESFRAHPRRCWLIRWERAVTRRGNMLLCSGGNVVGHCRGSGVS